MLLALTQLLLVPSPKPCVSHQGFYFCAQQLIPQHQLLAVRAARERGGPEVLVRPVLQLMKEILHDLIWLFL